MIEMDTRHKERSLRHNRQLPFFDWSRPREDFRFFNMPTPPPFSYRLRKKEIIIHLTDERKNVLS